MELEILASGDAQRAVGKARGDLIMRQVLRRSDPSSWHLGAQHEHVAFLLALFFALLAGVAIFLLIHAVKLQDLGAGRRKMRSLLAQLLTHRPAQQVAALFNELCLCHILISINSIDIRGIILALLRVLCQAYCGQKLRSHGDLGGSEETRASAG